VKKKWTNIITDRPPIWKWSTQNVQYLYDRPTSPDGQGSILAQAVNNAFYIPQQCVCCGTCYLKAILVVRSNLEIPNFPYHPSFLIEILKVSWLHFVYYVSFTYVSLYSTFTSCPAIYGSPVPHTHLSCLGKIIKVIIIIISAENYNSLVASFVSRVDLCSPGFTACQKTVFLIRHSRHRSILQSWRQYFKRFQSTLIYLQAMLTK
jgi:hypothetical protein